MRRLVLAACLALSGCLLDFPSVDEGPFPCAVDGDCADDFSCQDGVCARPGATDAGPKTPDAAGVDAAADAGEARDGGEVTDATADAGAAPDATPEDTGPVDAGCDGTWCGPECVDTQTNPEHCGLCNNDCMGAACSFGQCRPLEVHRVSGAKPTRIVFDADAVYWADQRLSGMVLGRPADLSAATFVVHSPVRYPTALTVSGGRVIWSALDELSGARNGGVFYKEAPFSGALKTAATDQSNPRALAATSSYAYWNSNSPLYVRAHALGGPDNEYDEVRISSGSSYANAMVVSDTEVVWADAQADIWARPSNLTTSAAPRPVVTTSDGEASDLILHDGTLYWAEDPNALQGQGRIFSAPLATGVVSTVVGQAHPNDQGQAAVALAFSQGYLYYVTGGVGGRGGGLFRVPHTGGTPELLEQGAATDELRGVAVGAGRIFWTQDDAVYALREP